GDLQAATQGAQAAQAEEHGAEGRKHQRGRLGRAAGSSSGTAASGATAGGTAASGTAASGATAGGTAASGATHVKPGEDLAADAARNGSLDAADRPGRGARDARRHDAVEDDGVLVTVDGQGLRLRGLAIVERHADLRATRRQTP